MKNRIVYCAILILLFSNHLLFAEIPSPDTLVAQKELILNDVQSIDVAKTHQFTGLNEKLLKNFPFKEDSYHYRGAFKAVVYNKSGNSLWYLKVNGVDVLYVFDAQDSVIIAGGTLIHGVDQEVFRPNELDAMVPLNLLPGENTLYFYTKSRMEISGMPKQFSLVSELQFLKENQQNIPYLELLLIGSSLVLFSFNLLIFFHSRDDSHLFYCLYILFGLIIIVNKVGLLPAWLYFPYSLYYYNEIGLTGVTVNFIFFMQSFLQMKRFLPTWHRVGIYIAGFAFLKVIINCVLISMNLVNLSIIISHSSFAVILTFLLISIFAVQKNKNPLTIYFTLGASSLLIGFVIFLIDAFYNSMDVEVGYFFGKIGMIMEILFFALGLGFKVRENQKEKENAQSDLISQLRKNRELQFKNTLNLERKVAERTEALKRVNQSKSRLFANISHDLRTPIMLINGYLENIRKNWLDKLPDDVVENCNGIEKNSHKLTYLTDEIYELIQLESGAVTINLRPFKLNDYLSSICRLFYGAATVNDINLKYQDNFTHDAVIEIDPEKFEKIMYNLVSNALKFTNKGGEIVVSLDRVEEQVAISVADTGIGMDEETMGYIYTRYFQGDHKKYNLEQGFGIGLSIVKEMVELHGGQISAISKQGKGSVFTLTFPVSDKSVTEESAKPSFLISRPFLTEGDGLQSTQNTRKHLQSIEKVPILIVDDHSEIREYLRSLLAESYEVLEAQNGEEAIVVLKNYQVKLIITDLMMPIIDGYSLIDRLKSEKVFRNTPVMVVSARNSIADKELLLSQGVADYLVKPFGSREFLARIKNIINRSNDKLPSAFENYDLDLAEQKMLKQIQGYVIHHIDSQITANMIANELAMSVRTFQRTVKKLTNHTPLEYIKEVKFNFIHELIETKKIRSLNDAAKAIGNSNVTRFKEEYQRRFGEHASLIES